jgi:poly-gamma-glutamate synthesis protein (capsule biosynthesis protein)
MKRASVGRFGRAAIASRRASKVAGVVGAAALLGTGLAVAALAASGLVVGPVQGARHATPSVQSTSSLSPSALPLADLTAAPVAATTAVPLSPLVPVASFWSTTRNVTLVDVARLWAGLPDTTTEKQYGSLAVAAGDVDALAAVLDITPAKSVAVLDPAGVKAAVRASQSTLGLLPAEEVTPDVRALSLNGTSLFGSGRIKTLEDWPLLVRSAEPSTFSLTTEWTLAAGGDVNLDRSVYVKAVQKGYGPDYPWSGGYAVISGYRCCSFDGGSVMVARPTIDPGALARRFSQADLALVTLEGSAPNDFVYRPASLIFTFDPALLAGLHDAGIDAVSLANNHIRNGGDQGVIETCSNLDHAGIAHAGAGADLAAARAPAWLAAAGLKVAFLAYSNVGRANWAGTDSPGAAPLDPAYVLDDIRSARAAGADIVIVMPHWGEEYSYWLSTEQKQDAADFVAAGADLVLGSHSHWVGAIQSIDRPQGPAFVDYSLGDLLFDLDHDIQSQEAVVLSLTFSGTQLLQVGLDPTVMVDGAQVALLDPAGDGRSVLDAIRRASRGLLGW